jgi:SSS family solute:Na+ symporter
MGTLLTNVDIGIFFGSLIAVMLMGLWVGRKEDTSEDYYMAGKQTRWWGVAGSIFGSNVSANHLVGMMGLGFSVGFAQSHFEISAIAGLLMLCYGFLPMYRKLNVFTLSEYLSRRYDDTSRVAYAVIMLIVIVVIQMVPGFYIGSRALNILVRDGETATALPQFDEQGQLSGIQLARGGSNYASPPTVKIVSPEKDKVPIGVGAEAAVVMEDGKIQSITLTTPGTGYDPDARPLVKFSGGSRFNAALSPGDVEPNKFRLGILLMALVTGTYTIVGGLKAVIFTDVVQSVLLLVAGIVLAFIVFSQPEVGGWAGMIAQDAAETGAGKMRLYKSPAHPDLPWTGVLTGLMVLHFYYWGANQFIVQRALSGRSDVETRFGIIVAGFFKLLIPFFSIAAGTAAYYYFTKNGEIVAPDAVFIVLLTKLVSPLGYGLVGLIAAGMVGAILSSLDSMLNSAATIITFDVYRRYVNPDATEKQLIMMGRWCILGALIGGAGLTILIADPNSERNFFIEVASHQSKLVAGVVVAFLLGMFWSRATAPGAIVAIIVGVVASYGLPFVYEKHLSGIPEVTDLFGMKLNFMHSVFIAALLSLICHVGVSSLTKPDVEKGKLTWLGQGLATPEGLISFGVGLVTTMAICAILAISMVYLRLLPSVAATIAGVWTWFGFTYCLKPADTESAPPLLKSDRFWAGLLAGLAVFMMFYFY